MASPRVQLALDCDAELSPRAAFGSVLDSSTLFSLPPPHHMASRPLRQQPYSTAPMRPYEHQHDDVGAKRIGEKAKRCGANGRGPTRAGSGRECDQQGHTLDD